MTVHAKLALLLQVALAVRTRCVAKVMRTLNLRTSRVFLLAGEGLSAMEAAG